MGMTNKEETLDWLYRLRSEIYVYMPKEWLMPMNNALDVAIDTVKREEMLEDWTKKCRKFEADYETRLKADLKAILEDLDLKIDEMYEPQFSKEGMDGFYWAQGLFKALVQEKINALKEAADDQSGAG